MVPTALHRRVRSFDEAVTKTMASGNFLEFLTLDPSLCERAAECGLRSFQIMAGALDGLAVKPRLLSHEGTFGVGYGVALFPVTGRDETRRYAAACEQILKDRLAARRAGEDPWVRLARCPWKPMSARAMLCRRCRPTCPTSSPGRQPEPLCHCTRTDG